MLRAILSFAFLFVAGAAQAQTSTPPAFLSMATLDRDGDGQVSPAEFLTAGAPAVAQRFNGMDTDRSNDLSPAEVEAARVASEERLRRLTEENKGPNEFAVMPAFADLDTNGNGRISKEEFVQAQEQSLRRRFQVLDRDGDGILREEEVADARKRFFQQVGRPSDTKSP
jgi:Ca2+-binding EF-hand superfamily protein